MNERGAVISKQPNGEEKEEEVDVLLVALLVVLLERGTVDRDLQRQLAQLAHEGRVGQVMHRELERNGLPDLCASEERDVDDVRAGNYAGPKEEET